MTITTIGEILIDLTQTHIDENGIAHFAANPGGAPANVAVAAKKLGAETAFIGCVGNDLYGNMLRDTLVQHGVNTDGLQVTTGANAASPSTASPAPTRRLTLPGPRGTQRRPASCISAA